MPLVKSCLDFSVFIYTIFLLAIVYSIRLDKSKDFSLEVKMNYTFDFSVIWENIDVLLAGVWLTLKISLLAIAFGLAIGILGSLCRTSSNKFLNAIALAYVEVIRNTP